MGFGNLLIKKNIKIFELVAKTFFVLQFHREYVMSAIGFPTDVEIPNIITLHINYLN